MKRKRGTPIQFGSDGKIETVPNDGNKFRKDAAVGVGEANPDDPLVREIMQRANDATELDKSRRWLVQVVFAFDREQEEKGNKIRKAVVFFFKPPSITARETSSILILPGRQMEQALDEARERTHELVARDGFVVEDDNRGIGLPKISRDGLLDFVVDHWQKHPVYTVGDVRLSFQHVEIFIPRENMLKAESRLELFGYIKDIMELMEKGFMFDPWTKSLRRIDEKGIGPWASKR